MATARTVSKSLVRRVSRRAMPVHTHVPEIVTALSLTLIGVAAISWWVGFWWISLLCWLPLAFLSHVFLLVFHETAHTNLGCNRILNEIRGLFSGTLILTPLTAYRIVHGTHHAYVATERDLELWPYVDPKYPRWFRCMTAVAELTIGLFYTPIIFLRGAVVAGNVPARQRLRLYIEYLLCLVFWGPVLGAIHWYGFWPEFLVGYVAPAMLAGNIQSFRKFTEHLGLLGDTPLSSTRTIAAKDLFGRLLSRSMLHIDHHGTHHRYARVPYHYLPELTMAVHRDTSEPTRIYRSYLEAFRDMLPSLTDPRIGKQWLAVGVK